MRCQNLSSWYFSSTNDELRWFKELCTSFVHHKAPILDWRSLKGFDWRYYKERSQPCMPCLRATSPDWTLALTGLLFTSHWDLRVRLTMRMTLLCETPKVKRCDWTLRCWQASTTPAGFARCLRVQHSRCAVLAAVLCSTLFAATNTSVRLSAWLQRHQWRWHTRSGRQIARRCPSADHRYTSGHRASARACRAFPHGC